MKTKNNPIVLPYEGKNVPHILIEVNQTCNIQCKACYKHKYKYQKPLDLIKQEIDLAVSARDIHIITIAGGEPTMHPQLPEVIRYISQKGKLVQMLSNGYDLKDEILTKYKEAGLHKIYIHIDSMQNRPDHGKVSSELEMNSLREKIAKKITRNGIYCGLSLTLYPERFHELPSIMEFLMNSKHIKWLLVTCCRDFDRITKAIKNLGAIDEHITPESTNEAGMPLNEFHRYKILLHSDQTTKFSKTDSMKTGNEFQKEVTIQRIEKVLQETRGMMPFAYVGSSKDINEKRWILYFSFTMETPGKKSKVLHLSPKFRRLVKLWNYLHNSVIGAYPFEMCYNRFQSYFLCLIYAFTTLEFRTIIKTLKFLSRPLIKGSRISFKHVVFQEGPYINNEGELVHCRECPDATVRNGKILPVCMADMLSPLKAASQREFSSEFQMV